MATGKVARLKARLANMTEASKRIGKNVLHSGETVIAGSAAAFAEGRMSDENGDWGYKGVPYVYMGGAIAYLTGLFAGERYSADFFAVGTGLVGSHLFRTMYDTGLEQKANGTQGRRQIRSRVPMGLREHINQANAQPQAAPRQRQSFGTAFDGMGAR